MLCQEIGLIQYRDIKREKRLLYYVLSEKEDSVMFKFLKSQMRKRTKRDLVTLDVFFGNLEYLNMETMNIEEIKSI